MKPTALIGLSLTLFMLLIVLLAAFLFLFQGRQTLQERVGALTSETGALTAEASAMEQELEQAGTELATADTLRATAAAALATAEADKVIMEGQLVDYQQEKADLTTQVEQLTSDLAEANDALAQIDLERQQALEQPPLVTIVRPEDGAVSPPGEPVEIIIVAGDAAGVTAVNLTIDGETTNYPAADERLFVIVETWNPAGEGRHTVSVMALNSNGRASDPITITITIAERLEIGD